MTRTMQTIRWATTFNLFFISSALAPCPHTQLAQSRDNNVKCFSYCLNIQQYLLSNIFIQTNPKCKYVFTVYPQNKVHKYGQYLWLLFNTNIYSVYNKQKKLPNPFPNHQKVESYKESQHTSTVSHKATKWEGFLLFQNKDIIAYKQWYEVWGILNKSFLFSYFLKILALNFNQKGKNDCMLFLDPTGSLAFTLLIS